MRPTTKDLANHLGMSRSTVDRVLNGRPGVRKATVDAVNKAIEELGFVRNVSAANLAKQRIYRLVFLLPKVGGDFVAEIESQILRLSKAVRSEDVDLKFRQVIETDQLQTVQLLSKLSPKTIDGIAILAPETPQIRDALVRVEERGIHVVRIVSGRSDADSSNFVGIDNVAAGKTAARLLGGFSKANEGRIAVVTDSMTSSDSAERRLGFDMALAEMHPNLSVLPTVETRGDRPRTKRILATQFSNFPDIQGVYVMASEAAFALEALDELDRFSGLTVVAHERTPVSLRYLSSRKVSALIVQDPGHIVRSAVRILRSQCDKRPPLMDQNEIRIEILLKENLGRHE